MKPIIIYTTTKDKAEAQGIALKLIESKLIACANIIENMTSIYRWQGKVEHANECTLILKSQHKHFPEIEAYIKQLHSYDCPSIVSWNIDQGSHEYLNWIFTETP